MPAAHPSYKVIDMVTCFQYSKTHPSLLSAFKDDFLGYLAVLDHNKHVKYRKRVSAAV